MIFGIGVDICEVDRFIRLSENEEFLKRIFSEEEISYCKSFKKKEQCFAARFAAKEAFVKALGTGMFNSVSLKEIEIKKGEKGNPYFNIKGETLNTFKRLGAKDIYLSISHEKHYAVAFVIITREN